MAGAVSVMEMTGTEPRTHLLARRAFRSSGSAGRRVQTSVNASPDTRKSKK
ncbi:hypothetical protein AcdelDRAFT_1590 [Acidovorax delafieldii 2AN]|uniref:Uncharacterized protein n=1 Tax=Acidovorax delafieldii 2AN TaxID=573060 RepID=C5T3W0_ACIDE|nr:hypothetical protein [Acidovorax delafieldii]EER60830.1 hypothetical protein AcdelDRAFT_1590 [Acidovorax delafieldii 2AN]